MYAPKKRIKAFAIICQGVLLVPPEHTALRFIWMCVCYKHSLYRKGSSESSVSYWSLRVRASKKMTPDATKRKPATDAMAMPTTSGSDTYSSQCSPRYHQFSPTRHLKWQWVEWSLAFWLCHETHLFNSVFSHIDFKNRRVFSCEKLGSNHVTLCAEASEHMSGHSRKQAFASYVSIQRR